VIVELSAVNWLAVVAAAVSAFAIGGLWYSALFAKLWMAESGMTPEKAGQGNPAKIFGLSFVLTLVASYTFAVFLGPQATASFGAMAGFVAGAAWVATSFGTNYLFEHKSLRLWLVNAGYHTVQFTVMGAILGAWR
jgi:hypothetical protein